LAAKLYRAAHDLLPLPTVIPFAIAWLNQARSNYNPTSRLTFTAAASSEKSGAIAIVVSLQESILITHFAPQRSLGFSCVASTGIDEAKLRGNFGFKGGMAWLLWSSYLNLSLLLTNTMLIHVTAIKEKRMPVGLVHPFFFLPKRKGRKPAPAA